ncbi:MAG: DUF11 domain-containing protein, partial [Saprospiraceae bacterium]|nr:DUF11 domain-containing protein [Saprospiraceae bacterium]
MIEIFDLALRKTLTTASPYTYGQTHQYRIVVFNQGNVTAQNIVVNDYIPDGYSLQQTMDGQAVKLDHDNDCRSISTEIV